MGLIVVHQPIGVLAHLKEVGLFFHQLNFVARRGNPTGYLAVFVLEDFLELAFGEVLFVIDRVPAHVFALVDISLVEELLEDLLNGGFVVAIGGTDKLVVGDFQFLPQFLDTSRHFIDVGLRILT